MNIDIRKIGKSFGYPAKSIELIIKSEGTTIYSDITNSHGLVDKNLIAILRNIADDLEEQNNLINEKKYETTKRS